MLEMGAIVDSCKNEEIRRGGGTGSVMNIGPKVQQLVWRLSKGYKSQSLDSRQVRDF